MKPQLPGSQGDQKPERDPAHQAGNSLPFDWAGERLVLFARRAVYWERRGTLIITDTHLGKDATFRSSGVPLPHGTTGADLARLDSLLVVTSAARLLVLGDFFHANRGRSNDVLEALAEWRGRHQDLRIVNIRGNHDLRAGDPPSSLRIEAIDEPNFEAPFAWLHEPRNVDGFFSMGGHLHPGVALEGEGGARIKSACFWFRRRSAVLPAFSDFAGIAVMRPRPADAVFALSNDEILRVA